MSKNWKTSVNELLAIFRGALLAIIPWLEKAKIKWKEEEAYDDWDNIAGSLYKNIVCSSLTGEVAFDYLIAKYNFSYDDYSLIDFIEVRSKSNPDKKYAFISFQSNSSPLDSIKVAELDKKDKVVGYTNLKFDGFEFVFVKNIDGKREVIHSIDVAL
jgi:hypothetical protein